MVLITGAGQLFLTPVWLLILFTHSVAYVGSAVLQIIYVPFKYFLSFLVNSSSVDFLIRTLVLYIELIKTVALFNLIHYANLWRNLNWVTSSHTFRLSKLFVLGLR